MTFLELVTIWNIKNPTDDFWNGINVHAAINKAELFDYLLYEFADMEAVDSNSGFFRNHVKNFFKIHEWNINKLAESLEFDYNPLENIRWHQHVKLEDDKTVDTNRDRDFSEQETTNFDTVRNDQYRHGVDWDESGSSHEQDVNYVSAFNDQPSPTGEYPNYHFVDTEHHRDTKDINYSKTGNEEKESTDDLTGHDLTNIDDMQTEGIVQKEVTDDDIHEDTDRYGNDGHTYQSMIEEERKQAQFNIYKWIAYHFSMELLVCVW